MAAFYMMLPQHWIYIRAAKWANISKFYEPNYDDRPGDRKDFSGSTTPQEL